MNLPKVWADDSITLVSNGESIRLYIGQAEMEVPIKSVLLQHNQIKIICKSDDDKEVLLRNLDRHPYIMLE